MWTFKEQCPGIFPENRQRVAGISSSRNTLVMSALSGNLRTLAQKRSISPSLEWEHTTVCVWQHVKLSDASLGIHPRYSLVVDEDVRKPTKEKLRIKIPLFIRRRQFIQYVKNKRELPATLGGDQSLVSVLRAAPSSVDGDFLIVICSTRGRWRRLSAW